jgi:dihydrofolate synthase/folylpolyglutamate synthase
MAFTYFSEQKVDVAVIEVGLGGRLDSTNVILPEVAIITNIGMDHMDLLGDTIEKIAFEKAGIIKPNVPVVIGEFDATSSIVFQTIAEERKAPITWASEKWKSSALNPHSNKIKISDEKRELTYAFDIEVPNPFLTKNIITALEAAEVLQTSKAIRAISSQSIKTGVENFRSNSNYVGRWQPLGNSPYIIADSGHNSHALIHTMEYLSALKYRKFHMVIGFVKGKDMEEILNLLPTEFEYYFCKPNLKRGMETSEYFQRAKKLGIKAESYISVQSAYQAALRCVEPNDLIFVGGSSFVVGEVLEFVASTI